MKITLTPSEVTQILLEYLAPKYYPNQMVQSKSTISSSEKGLVSIEVEITPCLK